MPALVTATLQYSQKVLITVNEEISYLEEYLQMEQLRFKGRLRYSIENSLADSGKMIPAMLLQPYVENALKHGIANKSSGGRIDVRFDENDSGDIQITIRDDGPGFSGYGSAEALGLRLSATRAETYNALFDMQISVRLYNEQDINLHRTGAVIHITINSDKRWKDLLCKPSS